MSAVEVYGSAESKMVSCDVKNDDISTARERNLNALLDLPGYHPRRLSIRSGSDHPTDLTPCYSRRNE
mgnify:FL=1